MPPAHYLFIVDETRVVLTPLEDVEGSDYINASYIDVGYSHFFKKRHLCVFRDTTGHNPISLHKVECNYA